MVSGIHPQRFSALCHHFYLNFLFCFAQVAKDQGCIPCLCIMLPDKVIVAKRVRHRYKNSAQNALLGKRCPSVVLWSTLCRAVCTGRGHVSLVTVLPHSHRRRHWDWHRLDFFLLEKHLNLLTLIISHFVDVMPILAPTFYSSHKAQDKTKAHKADKS